LEIIYFKSLPSTQLYLLENLSLHKCIWTEYQTNGIGSRGNSWIGEKGNLFFSFSISKFELPKDLPLQSISIYFMYILKSLLNRLGSKVEFKWPNDLFLKNNKVGGVITNIKNDIIIVGIGLNSYKSSFFGSLDIHIENRYLLKLYLDEVLKWESWESIFYKYKKDFYSTNFVTSEGIVLKDVILNKDGSITINNERKFSLR